jgi:hypothetical protein
MGFHIRRALLIGDPVCVISNGLAGLAIAVQLSRDSIALRSFDDLRFVDQNDLRIKKSTSTLRDSAVNSATLIPQEGFLHPSGKSLKKQNFAWNNRLLPRYHKDIDEHLRTKLDIPVTELR